MEKLIKPVEYAQELGISRQAVYAKIKRGILQSKNVDGKLYIVVETKQESSGDELSPGSDRSEKKRGKAIERTGQVDYDTLLHAKDETIGVLKETIKDLKESNQQMSTTLRGEIDLLKEAFHEMRTLYVSQIEHIRQPKSVTFVNEKPIEISTLKQDGKKNLKREWISLKKFFKKQAISKRKKQENIIRKLKKAHKKGDTRIQNKNGEIRLMKNERFRDILE
jgi:predicted DNA-binding protein YlxM (UPF0122 family)